MMKTSAFVRGGWASGRVLVALAGVAALAALPGCNEVEKGLEYARELKTRAEPPVQVGLQSFTFSYGYYVVVQNTSSDKTLTDVVVTYAGVSGNSKSQRVGTLPPGRWVRLDPEEIDWVVERNETVRVSADGYLSKSLATNDLIR
jgi:hypothetical protein